LKAGILRKIVFSDSQSRYDHSQKEGGVNTNRGHSCKNGLFRGRPFYAYYFYMTGNH